MNLSKLLASNGFIVVNKHLAKTLGHVSAMIIGVMCSKYDYYESQNKLEDGEYFYLTRDCITDETGIGADAQRTAMSKLQEMGILSVVRKGVPSKNFYKINFDKLSEMFTSSGPKNPPLVVQNSDSSNKYNNKENNTNIDIVEKQKKPQLFSNVVKKPKSRIDSCLAHLNEKAGTRFSLDTQVNRNFVQQLLNKKYTEEDIKKVIDYKCNEWIGTEWQKYLRPSTLFRLSNFENYLAAAEIKTVRKVTPKNAQTSIDLDLRVHNTETDESLSNKCF